MGWSWELMLHAFRGLGGRIDNVARKPGLSGRGLVPIDPEKPILIHVPTNLIVSLSDLEFADDRLRVKEDATSGIGERAFLEHYLNDVAWNGGGKAEATTFFAGLDELPPEVRDLLSSEFAMKPLFEGGDERVQQWFLNSRCLGWRGGFVIVPLIELIEHDSSAKPAVDHDGFALSGRFTGEIRMKRIQQDPVFFFRRFGYASPERIAFSQPLSLEPEGCTIEVQKTINMGAKLGSMRVPEFKREGDVLGISCLMLGNSAAPRVPRGIFRAMTKGMSLADADQIFDFIQHHNRMIFLGVLKTLEPFQGRMIREFRTVVLYQLEAMSYCVGAREP
jgi:hypothetical protein